VSPIRRKIRNHETNILQGELRKINPSNFNGDYRKGEKAETWLLEMKKYFQLHDYPS
jgi:hypothetical protein